jgi:hypothetical protein
VEEIDAALSEILGKIPVLSKLEEQSGGSGGARFGEIIASTRHALVDRIASIAPNLKHPDFQEEAEFRAVRVVRPGDAAMDYHIKGAAAVPHYKLRLDAAPGDFPIDEITVGPGPHQDLARRGLDSIVNKARVRIKVSQTPLRSL